jgi:hypothetical protein
MLVAQKKVFPGQENEELLLAQAAAAAVGKTPLVDTVLKHSWWLVALLAVCRVAGQSGSFESTS